MCKTQERCDPNYQVQIASLICSQAVGKGEGEGLRQTDRLVLDFQRLLKTSRAVNGKAMGPTMGKLATSERSFESPLGQLCLKGF